MKVVLLLSLLGSVFSVRLGGYQEIKESTIPDEVLNKATDTLLSVVSANSLTAVDIRSHIVTSERQLVAGFNYHFVVDIDSSLAANGVAVTCDFVVFFQSWTKTNQLTKSECTSKTKRQLGGGISSADCNDGAIQEAVREAVRYVNSMANSLYHMTPVKIANCKQQCLKEKKYGHLVSLLLVVRGMRYSFNVSFQQSTCMNDQEHLTSMLNDCPPSNSATHTDHFHCEIIDTAWMTPRYSTNCKMSQA